MASSTKFFQTGGSLSAKASTYVKRPADEKLYQHLNDGDFCYILTARQMGKSSMKVRTIDRLRKEGWICGDVDITSIGIHHTSQEDWYYSFLTDIAEALDCEDEFEDWWDELDRITPVKRMVRFWDEILLKATNKPIAIFIDEIDSMLSLDKSKFSTDDFFAGIRAVYNLRASKEDHNRLHFCILGVAAPEDLMNDSARTPFNIGVGFPLANFSIHDVSPMLPGLEGFSHSSREWLSAVMDWSGGQPYLTQVLADMASKKAPKDANPEDFLVQLVKDNFLSSSNIESEANLANIQRRIVENETWKIQMLACYRAILDNGSVNVNLKKREQIYLKLSGLVIEENGKLVVANKIYRNVFDETWLDDIWNRLARPFASEQSRWEKLGRNEDALLKGTVLQEALEWAEERQDLTNSERDFLEASKIYQVKETEAALRLQERERQSRILAIALVLTAAFLVAAIGAFLYAQGQASLAETKRIEAVNARDSIEYQRQIAIKANEELAKQTTVIETQNESLLSKSDSLEAAVNEAQRQAAIAHREKATALQNKEANDFIASAMENLQKDPNLALDYIREGAAVVGTNSSILSVANDIISNNLLYKNVIDLGFEIQDAIFSHGDTRIIAYGNEKPVLYVLDTEGRFIQMLTGFNGSIIGAIYFSYPNFLVAYDDTGLIKLWKAENDRFSQLATYQHYREIVTTSYREDNTNVLFLDKKGLLFEWAFSQDNLLTIQKIAPYNSISKAKISPSNEWYAIDSEEGSSLLIKLDLKNTNQGLQSNIIEKTFDLENATQSGTVTRQGDVVSFDFSEDYAYIGYSDGKLYSFYLPVGSNFDGEKRSLISGARNRIENIDVSIENRNFVFTTDNRIFFKNDNNEYKELKYKTNLLSSAKSLALGSNKASIISGIGNEIIFWNLNGYYNYAIEASNEEKYPDFRVDSIEEKGQIWALKKLPNSNLILTGRNNGALSLINTKGSVAQLIKQEAPISSLGAYEEEKIIASGNAKGELTLYGLIGNKLYKKETINLNTHSDFEDSEENDNAVLLALPHYYYHSPRNSDMEHNWRSEHFISKIDFSKKGQKLFVANIRGEVYEISYKNPLSVFSFYRQNLPVFDFEIIRNRTQSALYITSGNSVKRITSFNEKTVIESETWISTIKSSPDGKILLIGHISGLISVYRLENGDFRKLIDLNVHRKTIQNIEILMDGDYFCSADQDGIVIIWNKEGKVVQTFNADIETRHANLTDLIVSKNEQTIYCSTDRSFDIHKFQTIFGAIQKSHFAEYELISQNKREQTDFDQRSFVQDLEWLSLQRNVSEIPNSIKSVISKLKASIKDNSMNLSFIETQILQFFSLVILAQKNKENDFSGIQLIIEQLESCNSKYKSFFLPLICSGYLVQGDTTSILNHYESCSSSKMLFLEKFSRLISRAKLDEEKVNWNNQFLTTSMEDLTTSSDLSSLDHYANFYYESILKSGENNNYDDLQHAYDLYHKCFRVGGAGYLYRQRLFELTKKQIDILVTENQYNEILSIYSERISYFMEKDGHFKVPLLLAHLHIGNNEAVTEIFQIWSDKIHTEKKGPYSWSPTTKITYGIVFYDAIFQKEKEGILTKESIEWATENIFSSILESSTLENAEWAYGYFVEKARYPKNKHGENLEIPELRFEKRKEYFEQCLAFWKKKEELGGKEFDKEGVPVYLDFLGFLVGSGDYQNAISFGTYGLELIDTTSKYRIIPNLGFAYLQMDSLEQLRNFYREWGPKKYPLNPQEIPYSWYQETYPISLIYDITNKHPYYPYDNEEAVFRGDGQRNLNFFEVFWFNLGFWHSRSKEFITHEAFDFLLDEWILAEALEAGNKAWKHLFPLGEIGLKALQKEVAQNGFPKDFKVHEKEIVSKYQYFSKRYLISKEYDKAIKFITKALSSIPDEFQLKGRLVPSLANAYICSGQLEEAKSLFEKYKNQKYPVPLDNINSYWGAFARTIKIWPRYHGTYDQDLRKRVLNPVLNTYSQEALAYLKKWWITCEDPTTLEDGGDFFSDSSDGDIPLDFKYALNLYLKASKSLKGKKVDLMQKKIPLTFLAITGEHIQKRNFPEVIHIAKKAVDLIPQDYSFNGRLYPALVNGYLLSGDWDNAKAIFDKMSDQPYPISTYASYRAAFISSIQFWRMKNINCELFETALNYL